MDVDPQWVESVDWEEFARAAGAALERGRDRRLLPDYPLAPSSQAVLGSLAAFVDPLSEADWIVVANRLYARDGPAIRIGPTHIRFQTSNPTLTRFIGPSASGGWTCLMSEGPLPRRADGDPPRFRVDVWRRQAVAVGAAQDLTPREIRLLRSLLVVDPSLGELWEKLATHIRRHPEQASAITDGFGSRGDDVSRVNSKAAEALTAREASQAGKAARRVHDWSLAEAFLLRACELDKGSHFRTALAALWADWGKLDSAERLYAELLVGGPDPFAMVGLARLKRSHNQLAEAETLCRQALAIQRDGAALTTLGGVLRAAHRSAEARDVFAEAVATGSGKEKCWPLAGLAAAEIDLEGYDAGEATWHEYAARGCPPAPDTESLRKLLLIYRDRGDLIGEQRIAELLRKISRSFARP